MPDDDRRKLLRYLLSAFYIAAGTFHILVPRPFTLITPDWVPHPFATVVFTGMCEIAGGVGLLIPGLRRAAGLMLALYAVCVFPANLKHAFEGMDVALSRIAGGIMVLGWHSNRFSSGFRSTVPH
jgi:uncharacterized membrane protein